MLKDNYNFDLVKESKISKSQVVDEKEIVIKSSYKKGDRIFLLDKNDVAIVYEGIDDYNNLKVLYKDEIIEVNYRRIRLEISAEELYPSDYDLDSLFISYKERKLERDIKRGSKKALKKIQKDIRERSKQNEL